MAKGSREWRVLTELSGFVRQQAKPKSWQPESWVPAVSARVNPAARPWSAHCLLHNTRVSNLKTEVLGQRHCFRYVSSRCMFSGEGESALLIGRANSVAAHIWQYEIDDDQVVSE